jgi:hypothetical protein
MAGIKGKCDRCKEAKRKSKFIMPSEPIPNALLMHYQLAPDRRRQTALFGRLSPMMIPMMMSRAEVRTIRFISVMIGLPRFQIWMRMALRVPARIRMSLRRVLAWMRMSLRMVPATWVFLSHKALLIYR